MSRNFTTEVDTQREYFNASYFNQSGATQVAKYETTLLKPFFHDPDKWKLSINRLRVPLSGIPLTKNNIPFNQWQVGVGYFNGTQQQIELQYVPQINPQTTTQYSYYNISNNNKIQTITLQPDNVQYSSIMTGINYSVLPTYDQTNAYPTVKTYYILSNDNKTVNVYQNGSNSVMATLPGPTSFNPTESFQAMVGMCADTNGTFYYGYTTQSTSGQEFFFILEYNRTGANTWNPVLTYTSNSTLNNVGMQFSGMLAYGGILIVYINYPTGSPAINCFYAQWSIGTAAISTYGRSPSNNWVSAVDTNYIYRTSSDGVLTASTTLTIQYSYSNVYADRFLGFDSNGYLLIHRVQSDLTTPIGYQAIDMTAGGPAATVAYTFTPQDGSYGILNAFSELIPVDSGPVDIFTYQTFLNQINSAYQIAFNSIKDVLGATFQPTEPPKIIYEPATKLFSVICDGHYTITDTSGNPTFQVFMNQNLWNNFLFPTFATLTNGNNPEKQLLVQNNGVNAIQGTGSSTLPQFVYIQQEVSTIYAFNDLTRIIVGTTLVPVSGDGEGKTFSTNGFASNNSLNMITDIIPDTSTLSSGSLLIYVPAGILRWYNLYAQQPFSKIDLLLFYETKDGNIYPVNIINGEMFSVKLEFKKGPGDF